MVMYLLMVTLLLGTTYIAVCARNWNARCKRARNRKEN